MKNGFDSTAFYPTNYQKISRLVSLSESKNYETYQSYPRLPKAVIPTKEGTTNLKFSLNFKEKRRNHGGCKLTLGICSSLLRRDDSFWESYLT